MCTLIEWFCVCKKKENKKGITKGMNGYVKKKREGINNYVLSLNGFVCVNIKIVIVCFCFCFFFSFFFFFFFFFFFTASK